MLTVACVLSEGPLRRYDRSHVERLEAMVAEHLMQDYEFYCLDDSPLPGWWAKVSLFEPGRFRGRVLYLDLDVTVVGSLDDLASFAAPFVTIKDWNRRGLNSSVMVWDAGYADVLYERFDHSVMDRLHGDQNWIEEQLPRASTFPKWWCRSYKRCVKPRLDGSLPEDCRVVVYHGYPKPWEVKIVDRPTTN